MRTNKQDGLTSRKTSSRMALMLVVLTLLMIPFRLFFSASHVRRWYSGLARSSFDSAIMRASLNGGTYTPPVLPARGDRIRLVEGILRACMSLKDVVHAIPALLTLLT